MDTFISGKIVVNVPALHMLKVQGCYAVFHIVRIRERVGFQNCVVHTLLHILVKPLPSFCCIGAYTLCYQV